MKDTGDPVKDALDRIEALNLPHPTGPLLSAFVTQALNPLAAADYLENRLDATDVDKIIADWTFIIESVTKTGILPPPADTASQQRIRQRDGDKCCITGRQGTKSDPLITTAILPIPKNWANSDNPNVANMLGAFFGPAYRDWWLSYIKNPSSIASLQNHWLVSKSTALLFSRGLVRLDRFASSMIDFEVSSTRISPDLGRGGDDDFVCLRDHSESGYQVVDARFVGTHARLSPSIQCINLARQFAKQQTASHPKPWPIRWVLACQRAAMLTFSLPGKLLSTVAWTVWRILPQGLRLSTYFKMSQLQTAFFGRATYGTSVVKLPFGLFLKQYLTAELCRNEFATLQMLRKCSTIPVPEPLDMIIIDPEDTEGAALKPGSHEAPTLGSNDGPSIPAQQSPIPEQESPLVEIPPFEPQSAYLEREPQLDIIPPFDPSSLPDEPEPHDTAPSQIFIVMSGIPGSSLDQSIESISDPDLAGVCEDLRGYLRQLQTIKNTVNAEFPICSTIGEGILDHRLNGPTPSGPFKDEASFNQLLAYPDDPAFQGHKIVYSHADLNPRNILVDRFRQDNGSVRWGISGIIDWETAGFFPEYWEYTKSRYEAFRWSKRLADFLENSIGAFGKYANELQAESRNWQRQVALG